MSTGNEDHWRAMMNNRLPQFSSTQQVIENLSWLEYAEVVVNLNYHEVTEEVHHSNLIPAKDK